MNSSNNKRDLLFRHNNYLLLIFIYFVLTTLLSCSYHSEEKQYEQDALIKLSYLNEIALAQMSFTSPVETIPFSIDRNVNRDSIGLITPGVKAVTNDALILSQPTSNLGIKTIEESTPQDRIYPYFEKIHDGLAVVNLDYLLLDVPETEVRFLITNAVDPQTNECSPSLEFGLNEIEHRNRAIGRYIVLADSIEVCEKAENAFKTSILFSNNLSLNSQQTLRSMLSDYQDFFRSKFENLSEFQPKIIIVENDLNSGSVRQGDAGWLSTIFMRFYRKNGVDKYLETGTGNFLPHEMVHELFGKKFRTVADEQRKISTIWLQEGTAEYLSLLAGLDIGYISQIEFFDNISARTNACLQRLNDHFLLSQRSPNSGSLPYDCGVFVSFIFDQSIRVQSNNNNNLFDFWRDYLQEQLDDRNFEINAFEVLASLKIESPLKKLFYGPQFNANDAEDVLTRFQLEYQNDPVKDKRAIRQSLIYYLFDRYCDASSNAGSRGFYTEENKVILDISECSNLANKTEIYNIEGHSVIDNPHQIVSHIRDKCSLENDSIKFNQNDQQGVEFSLKCSPELPLLPSYLLIKPHSYFMEGALKMPL